MLWQCLLEEKKVTELAKKGAMNNPHIFSFDQEWPRKVQQSVYFSATSKLLWIIGKSIKYKLPHSMKAKKKENRRLKCMKNCLNIMKIQKPKYFYIYICVVCLFFNRKESRQNIFGQDEMHNVQKIYHGAFVGKEWIDNSLLPSLEN